MKNLSSHGCTAGITPYWNHYETHQMWCCIAAWLVCVSLAADTNCVQQCGTLLPACGWLRTAASKSILFPPRR